MLGPRQPNVTEFEAAADSPSAAIVAARKQLLDKLDGALDRLKQIEEKKYYKKKYYRKVPILRGIFFPFERGDHKESEEFVKEPIPKGLGELRGLIEELKRSLGEAQFQQSKSPTMAASTNPKLIKDMIQN